MVSKSTSYGPDQITPADVGEEGSEGLLPSLYGRALSMGTGTSRIIAPILFCPPQSKHGLTSLG